MSLSIGIVGLPNVGKSTLFNALRSAQGKLSGLAQIGNFPFTTIEPNVGVVNVPDERLATLGEISNSQRIVPATVRFIDIAGLIAGAHKGEGLGNKFLAHIREVDAIAMVVRTFEHKDVVHISGEILPKDDIETIMTELVLADMETLGKRINSVETEVKSGDKISQKKLEVYKKIERFLNGKPIRPLAEGGLDDEEKKLVGEANFLTLKPFLYVFNVNEEMAAHTPEDIVEQYELATKDSPLQPESVVVISAKIESELSDLCEDDRCEYLRELGLDKSGLERLISAANRALDLITFFTANKNEAHAWNLCRGGNAFEAAGKVHSDFAKKFIKAEVAKYDDFVKYGGWKGSKEKGLARLEGKDYEVKDGDVVFFRHG